jgi:hypothetical protein
VRAAFDEEVFSWGVGFAFEEGQETYAAHFGAGLESCGGEQSGCEVFSADKCPRVAAGFDDTGPADEEGHV